MNVFMFYTLVLYSCELHPKILYSYLNKQNNQLVTQICYRVFASRHIALLFRLFGRQTQCTCVKKFAINKICTRVRSLAPALALSPLCSLLSALSSLLSQCWSTKLCKTTDRQTRQQRSPHSLALSQALTSHIPPLSLFPLLSSPFCVDKDSSAGGIAIGIAIAGERSLRVGGQLLGWDVPVALALADTSIGAIKRIRQSTITKTATTARTTTAVSSSVSCCC